MPAPPYRAVPHRRRRRTIPGRCPAHRSIWCRHTSHFRQPSCRYPHPAVPAEWSALRPPCARHSHNHIPHRSPRRRRQVRHSCFGSIHPPADQGPASGRAGGGSVLLAWSAPAIPRIPFRHRSRRTPLPPLRECRGTAPTGTPAREQYMLSSYPVRLLSHGNRTSAELITDRGTAMAANSPQNFPQLTGRSPTSFPVCPFMAKRKSFPCHLVFSIQTGIRA